MEKVSLVIKVALEIDVVGFLHIGCHSCHPSNTVKALKENKSTKAIMCCTAANYLIVSYNVTTKHLLKYGYIKVSMKSPYILVLH